MKVQIPADEWAALCEALGVTDDETPLQAAKRLRGDLAEAQAHLHPKPLVVFDEARDVPERVFETDPPPPPTLGGGAAAIDWSAWPMLRHAPEPAYPAPKLAARPWADSGDEDAPSGAEADGDSKRARLLRVRRKVREIQRRKAARAARHITLKPPREEKTVEHAIASETVARVAAKADREIVAGFGEAVLLEHVGGDEYRGRFTQPLRFHEGERVRVGHPTAVRVTNGEGE